MSLGSRIKERREQLDLSRNDLANKIGVTPSAIANYENGISSPKIEFMYKLFDALKCDANYLHQDDIKALVYENSATPEEFENIIKKYRDLDPHGKKMVDFTLNEEWERSVEIMKEGDRKNSIVEFSQELIPDAAHPDESLTEITDEMIQTEDDIMDDENF